MLPQQIVLGHLNYETIIPILDKVKGLLDDRGLTAVTIHDYYGDASEEEIKAAAPEPTPTPEENTPAPEQTAEAPETPTQKSTVEAPTQAPTTRYEDEVAANQQATTAPVATATTAPAASRR